MIESPSDTLARLLIEKHGVPASDVKHSARIVHDLGVDGDDAAELLHDLQAAFGTDLTALDGQWRTYFNTEGASPRAILIGVPAIILCGGLAGVLVAWLQWPKLIVLALTLALFVSGGWAWSRWFGKGLHPVTVGGLAEIIQAGKWPDDPLSVR
ncbi:acyl carrier protein [Sphingobium sp.]|uniref:acyl carrier protein n=1 Tax=Sphingobium sp. TaxID=1912891 RepID=UPI0035C6D6DE